MTEVRHPEAMPHQRPPADVADASDAAVTAAHEPASRVLRDLRTGRDGLSEAEAARRLTQYGPNRLPVHRGPGWPRELLRQVVHPLALLLDAAAVLAFVAGTPVLGAAVVAVVVLNAAFAFAQERQAEHAVEALQQYLAVHATVVRSGRARVIESEALVPGDVVEIAEGERITADCRVLEGEVDVDLSAMTGESVPQRRTAAEDDHAPTALQATDVVFSGTACTAGTARVVVLATGAHTELGRIAALSQRVRGERSPLERQVQRVAWLIAGVAVAAGVAFLPLGMLAGLSLKDAFIFAAGLLVANVPEGLLPIITLALAIGVRDLARRGAVVKRLSAVETLGSTTVICTDKTGTLTENRMRPVAVWCAGRQRELDGQRAGAAEALLAEALGRCTTVAATGDGLAGDPTELAALEAARRLGVPVDPEERDKHRRRLYAFDSARRLMSTADEDGSGHAVLHVKGAPESVVARAATTIDATGRTVGFDDTAAADVARAAAALAVRGLRVLAVADRRLPQGEPPAARDEVESDLRLLGLVALLDPPRAHVKQAVSDCHAAGLRVHIVTGDHAATAAEVAREVGIGRDGLRVTTGAQAAGMSDDELAAMLTAPGEMVFARSTPEDKLRIADVLDDAGDVVAMTGDGVNDAPALRRAHIGVAMGRSGTDVAREAATMVLSDDDFATIVAAIAAGRRVYDNVRKFIVYIFAHAVPEVVPFLVFALSGGGVPLPLTVLQILAIDLGTEIVPALALGREPAEPGIMSRPPRPQSEGVVTRPMLWRAWGLLGGISAALVMAAFFFTLGRAGWSPGVATGSGTPLHHAYLQATTATFVGIVACQVGTAFAARTERASLRQVGVRSNHLLLWGIAFELAFTAALVYLPVANSLIGTAPLPLVVLAVIAPFPLVVWGVDELWRAALRRRVRSTGR